MKTLQALNAEAQVKQSPESYNCKSWVQSAVRLLEEGDDAKTSGDIDKAYVFWLRAATILIEIIPNHKQYKEVEFIYMSVRKKLPKYIEKLEELRKIIGARPIPEPSSPFNLSPVRNSLPALVNTTIKASSITPTELASLIESNQSVLVIDIRPKEDFILGHISGNSIKLVQIEPLFLQSPTTDADLEMFIDSFNSGDQETIQNFKNRANFDKIVYYDQYSVKDTLLMQNLLNALKNSLKNRPLLLEGGYDSWKSQSLSTMKSEAPAVAGQVNRTVYDYVNKTHSDPSPSATTSSQRITSSTTQELIHVNDSKSTLPVILSKQITNPFSDQNEISTSNSTSPKEDVLFNPMNGFQYMTRSGSMRRAAAASPKKSILEFKSTGSFEKPVYPLVPQESAPPLMPKIPIRSGSLDRGKVLPPPAPRVPSDEIQKPPRPFPRPPIKLPVGTRSSSPSPSPVTQRFYVPMIQPKEPSPASLRKSVSNSEIIPSHKTSRIGMAGLKNLGNTCFLNSIMQCLSATVPLARYFLDGSYRKHLTRNNPLGSKGLIAESFAYLVKSMWSEQDSFVTPIKFKDAVGCIAPQFKGNDQHDSQEFLAFLLDALHEDLNLASLKAKANIPDVPEGLADPVAAQQSFINYTARNWSIIVDIFQGQLKSCLKCLTCGKESITFNPFMYLTLPLPHKNSQGQQGGAVYIEECLDKFCETEILDGDNQWHCPRCKVSRRASKQLTIAKLPQILLIHFKRFYFQGPFRNKIETYVEFPMYNMDLTQYVPRWQIEKQQVGFVYDLYAVSSHYGGLNGGHYTAQVRNGYQDQWYNFDDSRVTLMNPEQVKTSAAYILFYVREMPPGSSSTTSNWWSSKI